MEQKEKKTKILAVDDDPVIRGLIKSIFLNSKFDVNEADSGEMALEILPDIMPDIILLDIIMSGMDGFEVLKSIRSNEKLKYIRIILLSSKNNIDERLKGYDLGTDDYMTKPFVGNELLAKVNVFAKLKHSEERNLSLTELVNSEIKKRMEKEKYIQDQKRLISMSDMIISIAHYWRQPLNALGITVQDIYDAYTHNELTEDYLKESVDQSMRHIAFMSSIIDSFQSIIDAKNDNVSETVHIPALLREALVSIKDMLDLSDVKCTINGLDYLKYADISTIDLIVETEHAALKQIITKIVITINHLIQNYQEMCVDNKFHGLIKIKLYTTVEKIIIQVQGNGVQLNDNEISHFFDPYYALGENRFDNKSLGLFFTKMLVEQHCNGKLFIKKENDVSIFQLEIPYSPPQSSSSMIIDTINHNI
ncbi:response regulator [Mucispirillum schaedleri]|uniref:Protein-glutamate methylesterase/protein-glutamine glutaminase n=1 Tax=Mucispirillum schaedleri ASF457 TaxID=1379858 RepID=A0AA97LN88_9BACT|nr:response regulator [Mucispirillum schaedleri]MCX4361088.1 response regulator [Mucispirillum schaedleri]USF23501.1 Protein-glutamate methylesterase/protein-glutamine glutaminase [Mucispirillum schaedleri ASF457]